MEIFALFSFIPWAEKQWSDMHNTYEKRAIEACFSLIIQGFCLSSVMLLYLAPEPLFVIAYHIDAQIFQSLISLYVSPFREVIIYLSPLYLWVVWDDVVVLSGGNHMPPYYH